LSYVDQNLSSNYRVIVFDKLQSNFAGISFDCVYKSYSGDFSDNVLIETIFEENHIDYVIHSLSTTVPATSFNAKYDIESNLVPTVELLNSMIRHSVYDIVYISSGGAIYGNGLQKHKEDEDVYPVSSYGVVKLSIEKYLMQYAQLYNLRPLILRLSNPYGKFHYSMKQGVINVALTSAIKQQEFTVWGDGNGKKDYIYIDDFVDILFKLVYNNVHTEVLNIASGQVLSVNEILETIKSNIPDFTWKYKDSSKFDVQKFELDNGKLKSIIKDYNFTSFIDGLKQTIDWVKNI
jgi:UDP-glucose 4-epimerase